MTREERTARMKAIRHRMREIDQLRRELKHEEQQLRDEIVAAFGIKLDDVIHDRVGGVRVRRTYGDFVAHHTDNSYRASVQVIGPKQTKNGFHATHTRVVMVYDTEAFEE